MLPENVACFVFLGFEGYILYVERGFSTNRADKGHVPAGSIVADGDSWLEYVHYERADKTALELGCTF